MFKIVFDGYVLIILVVFILGWLILNIIEGWNKFWYRLLKAKAWAKIYNPNPNMILDRKYGVKCKKHWWNKYKIYHAQDRNYDTDYLWKEANDIVKQIEKGEIKI